MADYNYDMDNYNKRKLDEFLVDGEEMATKAEAELVKEMKELDNQGKDVTTSLKLIADARKDVERYGSTAQKEKLEDTHNKLIKVEEDLADHYQHLHSKVVLIRTDKFLSAIRDKFGFD